MGADYVLDLVSEMEIAPAFPVCKSFFLVSSDNSSKSNNNKLAQLSANGHFNGEATATGHNGADVYESSAIKKRKQLVPG